MNSSEQDPLQALSGRERHAANCIRLSLVTSEAVAADLIDRAMWLKAMIDLAPEPAAPDAVNAAAPAGAPHGHVATHLQ